MMSGIVIVGGGQAAASTAAKLRSLGYQGDITLLGEEPVAPYQRPPLSKAYLLGDMPLERLTLRGEDFWDEHRITLRLGTRVEAIDAAQKQVRFDGEQLSYDDLVICTGAPPRRLPADMGGALEGVYTVRRLADVDRMQAEFRAGARLVVIGGGYIGLEAAAVARKLGLEVTLVEAAPRILGRVAAEATADAIRDLHQRNGVTIVEGTGITALRGETRVRSVELADGRSLAADFVIVGIGVIPAAELAEAAGLEIANGIAVNDLGQTSDPHIWAAGDCASIVLHGMRSRIESVGNAIDMGELVAENILGAGKDYVPNPWFWSDQFDTKLQIAGLNTGYDETVTRQGDGTSIWYFRAGDLIAVDALNDPRAYMVGKRLIEGGKAVTPAQIRETEDLKGLLK
jgi:3-phenylpropionate/trans-cinnamate dioxygenase ferredoxin reductase subunit